jgi:hypothetical protein
MKGVGNECTKKSQRTQTSRRKRNQYLLFITIFYLWAYLNGTNSSYFLFFCSVMYDPCPKKNTTPTTTITITPTTTTTTATVTFVRHGNQMHHRGSAADSSEFDDVATREDVALSEEGIAQSCSIVGAYDCCIVSPARRARRTLDEAVANGLPCGAVEVSSLFRERISL